MNVSTIGYIGISLLVVLLVIFELKDAGGRGAAARSRWE